MRRHSRPGTTRNFRNSFAGLDASQPADMMRRGLGGADAHVSAVPWAALLHDLGRASVSNGIWDEPDRLTTAEWEGVRLHPYYTERVLERAPSLEPLARLAGRHHERPDASGIIVATRASGQRARLAPVASLGRGTGVSRELPTGSTQVHINYCLSAPVDPRSP